MKSKPAGSVKQSAALQPQVAAAAVTVQKAQSSKGDVALAIKVLLIAISSFGAIWALDRLVVQ